jgi:hypothetical protein
VSLSPGYSLFSLELLGKQMGTAYRICIILEKP